MYKRQECYIVLLLGRDEFDPFFLQVKQAGASVIATATSRESTVPPGERVVQGQRLMQATPDVFLGWHAVKKGASTRHYYVRQLYDNKAAIAVDKLEDVYKRQTYRAKRDPKKTPEPMGATAKSAAKRKSQLPTFVIQEHHARALHWDFRLERDGVLVSWALPKGLPMDPAINHLAVHVEDHPFDYGKFEGTIPKGCLLYTSRRWRERTKEHGTLARRRRDGGHRRHWGCLRDLRRRRRGPRVGELSLIHI